MKELKAKILEALVSALPITAIVFVMALLPWFDFSGVELLTFSIGAVLLVLGIGLFNLGADLAMTPWELTWARAFPGRKSFGCCLSFALCWVLLVWWLWWP